MTYTTGEIIGTCLVLGWCAGVATMLWLQRRAARAARTLKVRRVPLDEFLASEEAKQYKPEWLARLKVQRPPK